jgi:hypothetical protein
MQGRGLVYTPLSCIASNQRVRAGSTQASIQCRLEEGDGGVPAPTGVKALTAPPVQRTQARFSNTAATIQVVHGKTDTKAKLSRVACAHQTVCLRSDLGCGHSSAARKRSPPASAAARRAQNQSGSQFPLPLAGVSSLVNA